LTIDAIVIGSGPNGLSAALVLAQAGCRVVVLEAQPTIGGGVRSAELTLPGFVHDVCSAVHPFAVISPFWRTLPLASYGLEWTQPQVMVAHPLDDGTVGTAVRSVDATAAGFGRDERAYARLIGTVVRDWSRLERSVLGPPRLPHHPVALGRFGLHALRSAEGLATSAFKEERTRAFFAGLAAHGLLPLDRALTAGFGLTLGAMCHVAGWPIPKGGAQKLTDALASLLRAHKGEIVTGSPVSSIDDLPPAKAILCDLSPRPLLRIAGHRFPERYRRQLERYRYGMGTFKIDFALDSPIPWKAEECRHAGTVHVGGTLKEIAASEQASWDGHLAERPFVLLSQPTVFDPTRAPPGKHVAWTYCHVPHGCTSDMTDRIERQIERFAPGFRERVLARSVMRPADIEARNANLVGGDIAAGVSDLPQFFARPTWSHYSTPVHGLYICSASTPPGVGVHGMCGYYAAKRALKEVFGQSGV
jgi:phytoene dehydrogenase-like protein